MNVYTFQLGKLENLLFNTIPYYDTTVKSGMWQLAPSWDIVMAVKSKRITPEQYEAQYMAMLEWRYFTYPEFFEWLISHEHIAFGCYCAAGKFCHRHLITKFLSNITDVNYCGEL
ncbi:hypothetical protein [Pseudomonas phage D6]|nr:hypothetical protein [Pseudomonas phage D6]